MNNSKLLKKSGLYLIGNMSSKLLTVLILPIYALYLTPDSLGYFDYSQTVINVLLPMIYLAIWEAVLKFVLSENDEIELNRTLSTSIIFVLLFSIFILLISFIITSFYEFSNINFIRIMLVSQGLAQIWQYYARALKRNNIYVISSVLSTVIHFLSIIVFVVVLKMKIEGLFLSYIIGQITIFFIIELKLKLLKKVRFSDFSIIRLINMIKFSYPLSFNLVSAWFISGYARFFITNNFGVFENGLYSFANKFSQILNLFGSVIVMAMVEEAILAKKESNFSDKFSKLLNNINNLFLFAILLLLPMVVIFYNFLSKTEFAQSIVFVPFLLLYTVFMILSSAIGVIFQVIERTQYQFITTLLGALATIVLSYTLKSVGVYSIIIAQLAGAAIMFISRFIISRKYLEININMSLLISSSLGYLVISNILIRSSWKVNIITFLLVLLIIINQYKEFILILFEKVKKLKE